LVTHCNAYWLIYGTTRIGTITMPLNLGQKQKLRNVLTNEDAFATSLLAICLDEYGTEIFDYEPESLWMALSETFNIKVPRINKDKLQAMLVAYTTDLPFISVEMFTNICNVLSGSEANFYKWDALTPEEIIWGIYELLLNVGIDRETGEGAPEFSHEVRLYMGVVLKNAGVVDPPDILRIAEFGPAESMDQWSDSPTMFNAIYDLEKSDKAALLKFLGGRIIQLLTELDDLPFKDRTDEWAKFRSAIAKKAQQMSGEANDALLART